MGMFIFVIGFLMFAGLLVYSIISAFKKNQQKVKNSLKGVGIGFILIVVGASMIPNTSNSSSTTKLNSTSNPKTIATPTGNAKTEENKIINNKYEEVTVTRHVDGDTVEITHKNGKIDKVRFIGVNTPESTTQHEPYGEESSNYTKSKLLNKVVYLEKDVSETDKYGRLLRYVWLEVPKDDSEQEIRSKMFNAMLALDGEAQQMTYPPDVKYADYFRKFVAEARNQNKGLWAVNHNGTTKGDAIIEDAVNPPKTESNTNNQVQNPTPPPAQPTPQTIQPPVQNNDNKNVTVYIGKTGDKYHRANCRTLKGKGNPISLEEALSQGREPCKVCNP